ncbi:MAG: M48 family metallopeptidase [Prevotellaceae bacterium]|nr:M48 family metallopeptidase [Candidatus Minthosoma caballi]
MQYNDPDFGTVTVTVNPRARSIIMRPEVDGLRVTSFRGATLSLIKEAIDKHRTSLLKKQATQKARHHFTEEEKEELRQEAKAYLPRRTAELAYMWGFEYESVKIQSSRTRWGSCSASSSINYSFYLMSVPEHLIDYVILHELCHTKHHDHSPAFWAEMNRVTDGTAKQLRQELRKYHTE